MRAFGPPQPDYPGGMGDPISTMKPGAFLRRMNQINVGNDKCFSTGYTTKTSHPPRVPTAYGGRDAGVVDHGHTKSRAKARA